MSNSTKEQNIPPYNTISNKSDKDEETFDVMRFIQVILFHKWKFLFLFFVVSISALAYGLLQTPYYSTSCNLFYNEANKEFVLLDNTAIKSSFDKEYWLYMMESKELARLILEKSGLPYSTGQLQSMLGVEIEDSKNKTTPMYRLKIRTYNKSDIPVITNAFITSLNELLLKRQTENSVKLIQFLDDKIKATDQKLSEVELKILDERIDNSNDPTSIKNYSEITKEMDKFRAELLDAQIELSSVKASRVQAEQELERVTGTVVRGSTYSDPLKVQLMNLKVDLSRALTINKEAHPAVKAIKDNINQIEEMIGDSLQQEIAIKDIAQNPLKVQLLSQHMNFKLQEISLEKKISMLNSVIEEYRDKILPDTTYDQQTAYRERELLNLTLAQLNSKLIETESNAHGMLGQFSIVDSPVIPERPSNRSLLIFVAFGAIAGVFAASGLIFIYDFLDNRIMIPEDYEKFYPYPVLGSIGHNRVLHNEMIKNLGKETFFEGMGGFGETVFNVKHIIKHRHNKLITLASPLKEEGKSLLSLCIASILARKGMKVLLADMDFMSPRLTKNMGYDTHPGLIGYMSGDISLNELFIKTRVEGLDFTSSGKVLKHPLLLYDNPLIKTYIKNAYRGYDVVLIDTPAILAVPEVLSLTELVDGIILVVKMGQTSRSALNNAVKKLGESKNKIRGAILNDIKKTSLFKEYNYYNYQYYYNKRISNPVG